MESLDRKTWEDRTDCVCEDHLPCTCGGEIRRKAVVSNTLPKIIEREVISDLKYRVEYSATG